MKLIPENIILKLVDGSTVIGQINMIVEGEMVDRVSDFFQNNHSDFITVFNVEEKSTMLINKRNILWIVPDEDGKFLDIVRRERILNKVYR